MHINAWPGFFFLLRLGYYYYYYYYNWSSWIFHTCVGWKVFPEIWMIASLLTFPRLFSEFWPILTMSQFFMVSTRSLISKTLSSFIKRYYRTFMFYRFSSSLPRPRYLFLFSLSFNFLTGLSRWQYPQFSRFSFFVVYHWSGRLAKIRWAVCVSNSQRNSFVLIAIQLCGNKESLFEKS